MNIYFLAHNAWKRNVMKMMMMMKFFCLHSKNKSNFFFFFESLILIYEIEIKGLYLHVYIVSRIAVVTEKNIY